MKTVDFSDIITVCGLKVYKCRCRQLIKVNEGLCIEGLGNFLTYARSHLQRIKTGFSQNCSAILNQILCVSFQEHGNKNSTEMILVT